MTEGSGGDGLGVGLTLVSEMGLRLWVAYWIPD